MHRANAVSGSDRRPPTRGRRGPARRRRHVLPALRWCAGRMGAARTHRAHARCGDGDRAPAAGAVPRLRHHPHPAADPALQPRRADTTEVIGTALAHKANGLGFRRIAARLGRAESTVRRWLRRATAKHLSWAYQQGATRLIQLAPDAFT